MSTDSAPTWHAANLYISSSVPFEKWMELDTQYIDLWSLGLVFKILAKTIPAVLKGAGAA